MGTHGKELLEVRLHELDVKLAKTEQRAAAYDIWVHLRCDALPPAHLTDILTALRVQIKSLHDQRELIVRRLGR
jgi:hypothetical protein